MHIKVSRSAIAEALSSAQSVVAAKSSTPVLQNVKIEAHDGKAIVIGSDLDVTIQAEMECEVIEDGETTLPAKLLSAAVGKVVDGVVEINILANEKAKIIAGTSVFRLNGISAKEYPSLPEFDGTTISLPAKLFREMLRKTSFAMSQDETRRALQGVHMEFKSGKNAVSVATDGRRLACLECSVSLPENVSISFTLPKKTVEVLMKKLPKDGDVKMTFSGSQVKIDSGSVSITSKLVDMDYPNYAQVIPKNELKDIAIDRAEFIGAIDRVSIFSAESASYSMNFKFADNLVVLTSKTADLGDSRDEVAIKYNGEAIDINFNPQYVRDVLNVIDEDEVEIGLANGSSPAIIRKAGQKDYIYVVMPLRV